MYGEGSSIEAISRVLGVKTGTVYSGVKKARWAGELVPILVQQKGHAVRVRTSSGHVLR